MKIQTSRHFLAKLDARRAARILPFTIFLSAAFSVTSRSHAASGTWNGTTDSLWATDTNWSSGAHPVTGDTASFLNSAATVNNRTTIDLGTGQAATGVTFDTANAAAYTIGAGAVSSQTLTLDATSAINMTSAVTNNELFNAAIVLGTGVASTTTITNGTTLASGFTLNFAGTVTGGTGGTAGIKTINTAGTGAVNFTNVLGAGGGTMLNLVETGTGTTTLSGSGTSAFSTLRASGSGGLMLVNGQTVTVAASSTYGTSSLGSRFEIDSGSVAFNGGIQSATSSGALAGFDGQGFKVAGGTFSASSVAIGRTQSFTSLQTAPAITTGFIVSGGTAAVTGAVNIAGSNSSATGLVSGGSLTVGGEFDIGNSTAGNARYNIFQVSGGTFTVSDTTNGIVLGRNATGANTGEFLVTGGTSTVEKISFGLSTTTTTSVGALVLNGAAGTLYVGSGGIVQGAATGYSTTINLTAGTLGAKSDWSSTLPMTLNGAAGTSVSIQAADAASVAHNITLSGAIGGAGGITKTGGGTLTLTAGNFYTGLTTINAGTLNINGQFALGGAVYAGTTFNGGTLQYATAFSGNGTGDITQNSAATPVAKPVTINAGGATIDTNGNAVTFANTVGNGGAGGLTKTGTGILTLAGANTYTGATNINAGTLLLSTGSLVSNTVSVTGSGALTLQNATSLADSSTLSLVSGTTLNLNGANGTSETIAGLTLDGNSVAAGTYTAAQLSGLDAGITFTGPETLTIAAVPEPSTYVGGVFLLVSVAGWSLRRRYAAGKSVVTI